MRHKILHVTAGMDPRTGGVTQAILTMIQGLSGEGMDNEVVCLDDPNANYLKTGFPVHALGPGKGPWCYSSKLIPWLKDNLRKYDTVIVHGIWLFHSFATQHASKTINRTQHPNRNRRIFLMPHGMLDPYFQKSSGRKLKAIRNFLYWKILENKTVTEADGILYTCNEELRLARQSFQPFMPRQETVIGLGVESPPIYSPDMSVAFQSKCPEIKDQSYFLYLGRIHEKKGVDNLVKAYKSMLREKGLAIPKLVIAGPGIDEAFGLQIKEMVENDPLLRNTVFFPGMLSGNAKWGAFYDCDAFILPSHQENFGIAVVEALACKKPVLISDQVNINQEIIQFEAGKVEADTLNGCKSLLKFWVNSETSTRERICQNAGKLYKTKYAIDQFASDLAKILH